MNNDPEPRSGYGVRAFHSRVDREQFSSQIGWRLPCDLIEAVKRAAEEEEGLRPGVYVTRILQREVGKTEPPISATELEQRVKFPEHLFHGKWM
jgi:hypothetical protein